MSAELESSPLAFLTAYRCVECGQRRYGLTTDQGQEGNVQDERCRQCEAAHEEQEDE